MIRPLNILAILWVVMSLCMFVWQAWHGDLAHALAWVGSGFCAAIVVIQNRARAKGEHKCIC